MTCSGCSWDQASLRDGRQVSLNAPFACYRLRKHADARLFFLGVIIPESKTLVLFGDEPDSPLTESERPPSLSLELALAQRDSLSLRFPAKPRPVGFGVVASVNLESFGIVSLVSDFSLKQRERKCGLS